MGMWLVDGSRNDQENNAEIGKSVLTYPMTVCIVKQRQIEKFLAERVIVIGGTPTI
jgi:hypothetical protein